MSGFLRSVNNLLDNLDEQVETVVDDTIASDLPTSRGAIQTILSRRGLQEDEDEDEDSFDSDESYGDDNEYYDDDDDDENWDEEEFEIDEEGVEEGITDLEPTSEEPSAAPSLFPEDDDASLEMPETETQASDDVAPNLAAVDVNPTVDGDPALERIISLEQDSTTALIVESKQNNKPPNSVIQSEQIPLNRLGQVEQNTMVEPPKPVGSQTRPSVDNVEPEPTNNPFEHAPNSQEVQTQNCLSLPSVSQTSTTGTSPPNTSGQLSLPPASGQSSRAARDLRKTQSELKQLRKNVVVLHDKLEAAEAELKAQQGELNRAAERMERDRDRHNEDRNDLMDEHDDELENQKDDYERLLEEQKERYDLQVEELQGRLQITEEQRKQEGGDWTTELDDVITRERLLVKKLGTVQDENGNLQSKVAKLETQQGALQNRLESTTQNAQNSTDRERQADDKLDAALSSHTRQLNQRKAREAELERMIADLSAALVASRRKEKSAPQGSSASALQSSLESIKSIKQERDIAVEELETSKAQLRLERQRCDTLQQELKAVTKERTEEVSTAQTRQRRHDQQVGDLTSNVSRLQTMLREVKRSGENGEDSQGSGMSSAKEMEQLKTQLRSLSEQLIRQQRLSDSSKTEILTLKSRLQTASARADNAEKSGGATNIYEMESGGNQFLNPTLRRRVKGGRAKAIGSRVRSIRSALGMDPGRVGESLEFIADTVDAIDGGMVHIGALFKQEPLARLGFFLYLLILHLWTFCLVIFHAHSYETVHGDFGSLTESGGLPNGPGALVQHSLRMGHNNP